MECPGVEEEGTVVQADEEDHFTQMIGATNVENGVTMQGIANVIVEVVAVEGIILCSLFFKYFLHLVLKFSNFGNLQKCSNLLTLVSRIILALITFLHNGFFCRIFQAVILKVGLVVAIILSSVGKSTKKAYSFKV